jgi:hypothetical protein
VHQQEHHLVWFIRAMESSMLAHRAIRLLDRLLLKMRSLGISVPTLRTMVIVLV